ncbi:MAG: hypothetical protein AAF363_17335 [Bacteroidota bacterium]
MPEIVFFNSECQIINVESSGKTDIEDWRKSLNEINNLSTEHNVKKVLVDTSLQEGSPSEVDIFNFAIEIPEKLKVAIYDPKIKSQKQEFLAKVGQARKKQLCLFKQKEKAIEWLHCS